MLLTQAYRIRFWSYWVVRDSPLSRDCCWATLGYPTTTATTTRRTYDVHVRIRAHATIIYWADIFCIWILDFWILCMYVCKDSAAPAHARTRFGVCIFV